MQIGFHDDIVARLNTLGHSQWQAIADGAGVPLSTIRKVAYRHTSNPRVQTLERIAAALNARDVEATHG